ncbi:MAG: hypothetical protein NT154_28790 [Verrucomicrobia bacterium]|nr:hypothetical protein [Verrucomicrobiota bacterium]
MKTPPNSYIKRSQRPALSLQSLDFRLWTLDFGLLTTLLLALTAIGATPTPSTPEPAPPATSREFYNVGTQQLRAGKLREAEASLESVLASQKEHFQSLALYNLGLVRFGQGAAELKKGPAAKPTAARGQAVIERANGTLLQAGEALAGNDVEKMVAAYMRGRGVRKELKSATEAVRRALQVHGAALVKWERSSGDFKSTVELKSTDADAQHNAEILDRCIAKLVDSLRELQECANGMGDKKKELDELMKQLKGRIPAPDMPPGAAGDEEEEEEQPMGPKPGQEEGPSKDGKEMPLSPEQAGWLLDGYTLGGDRRLPMGQGETEKPRDRVRPPW